MVVVTVDNTVEIEVDGTVEDALVDKEVDDTLVDDTDVDSEVDDTLVEVAETVFDESGADWAA